MTELPVKSVVDDRNEQIEELQNSPVYEQAVKQAEKYMRKNRAEYKRLRKHAEDALFEGKKAQYVYAIKKLRDMLKQPYTEELIDQMWLSSVAALRETFHQATLKYSENVAP